MVNQTQPEILAAEPTTMKKDIPSNSTSASQHAPAIRKDEAVQNRTLSSQVPVKMWNPIWLSIPALCCIIATTLIFVAALIFLWRWSDDHRGFVILVDVSELWTFAPTALLVLLIAIWRQVDFYCKALQPWRELQSGNAPAATLFRDYISPSAPVAIYRAFRGKHLTVILSISGFILLKLVTLFSTGLLIPSAAATTSKNVTLVSKDVLDSPGVVPSELVTGINEDYDDTVLAIIYGILEYGMDFPHGTSQNATYDLYLPNDSATYHNVTFNVAVNAFYCKFECEPILWTPVVIWNNGISPGNPVLAYNFDNDSYTLPLCAGGPSYCPSRQQYATYVQNSQSSPTRRTFGVVDVEYTKNKSDETKSNVSVLAAGRVDCVLSYTLAKGNLSYQLNGDAISTISLRDPAFWANTTWPGTNDTNDILLPFTDSLFDYNLYGNAIGDTTFEGEQPHTLAKFVSKAVNSTFTEMASNVSLLLKGVERAIPLILSQFVNQYFRTPDERTLEGFTHTTEQRLFISALSAWLMIGGLLCFLAATLLLMYFRSHDVVTENPESFALIVKMLRYSQSFNTTIKGCGNVSTNSLKQKLDDATYSSSWEHPYITKIATSNPISQVPPFRQNRRFWSPLVSDWWMVVLIVGLPIVVIVVLEVLQHLSDTRHGYTSFTNSSQLLAVIVTRYIPALVAFGISSLHNSLDFTVVSLIPFHNFKRRAQDVKKGNLMNTVMGFMPVHSLFESIRHHRWAAICSTVGSLVGSFLTIIVSDLYSVDLRTTQVAVQVTETTHFNGSWSEADDTTLITDNGAGWLTSLFEWQNMSYPQWTYDEFALPSITIDNKDAPTGPGVTSLNVEMLAWRGSLSCEAVSDFTFAISEAPINVPQMTGIFNAILPPGCPLPIKNITWKTNYLMPDIYEFNAMPSNGTVGKIIPFILMNETLEIGNYSTGFPGTVNPGGCPSVLLDFAYYGRNDTFTLTNYTQVLVSVWKPFLCTQIIEEFDTTARFSYPDLNLLQENPLTVDLSSARTVLNPDGNSSSFTYKIQDSNFPTVGCVNQLASCTLNTNWYDWSYNFDNFFADVFLSPNGISFTDALAKDGDEILLNRVQKVYRQYMAQVFSSNMRTSSLNPDVGNESEGTSFRGVAIIQTPRILQHKTPKIILQTMLAVMTLCAIGAYLLMRDMRRLLYHEPYSIAGMATLFAGSELCDLEIDGVPGCEELDERERKWEWIWRNGTVSLGWWNEGERPRFGIDRGLGDIEPRVKIGTSEVQHG
ncbi:hypothetical protein N431DRAFT_480609 [Stipitochalara longipes BDJ]|nr:hypothetical protein N431DRAFT_480609 [Stipitochalara longipes BDJ]